MKYEYNSSINIKFPEINNYIAVIWENVLVFREYTLKY